MALEPEGARPRRPFESTADPDLFFDSPACAATFGRLRAAMVWGEPLSVLTGEAGTGKTELLHRLMDQLEGAGLRSVLFSLPVSLEDLRARLPAAERGRRVAVGLDEAQALADSLLGALPALLADRPDIGILLVGQRELETKVAALEAGGAGVRVAVCCRLAPLDAGEVGQYIHHRWRQAGSGPSPFTPSAVKRIAEISGGIPQTINLLCSRALWLAQGRGQGEIGAEMADEAARDLMSATSRPAVRRSALAAAVAIPLVIAGAVVLWHPSSPPPQKPVESAQVEQPAAPVMVATPSPEPARTESVPAVESAPTGEKVARSVPPATTPASELSPRAPATREPPPIAPGSPLKDEALLRGAESGDVEAVRAMLGEGASPNARDAGGFTPLMLAVIHDQPAIADLLIARGAAVNAKNRAGLTALMLAAINDNTAALRALIARRADMNARTKSGWTALTYAAWRGYPDAVRLLLTGGADPTVIDREGWSILQYVSWRAAEATSGGDPSGNPAAEEAPSSPATGGAHTEVMTLLRQAGVKR